MSCLFIVLLALAPALVPHLASDTTVTAPYVRAPGERYFIDIEKMRAEYADPEAQRPSSVVRREWTAEVEVRGRRPGGFTLAWTYRQRDSPPGRRPARYDPAFGVLENVGIVHAADSLGRPQFVLNPLWVRTHLHAALEAAGDRTPPGEQPRLEAARAQATTTPGLGSLFLQDVERLHLVHGRTLTPGKTDTTHTTIRNPFGPGVIDAEAHVRLDSLDDEARRAYVTWTLTPDPDALARVVLRLLEGFAPGAVRIAPEDLAGRFRVQEHARLELDLADGWVHHAVYERRVQAGPQLRVERTTFVTRPPDAASGGQGSLSRRAPTSP